MRPPGRFPAETRQYAAADRALDGPRTGVGVEDDDSTRAPWQRLHAALRSRGALMLFGVLLIGLLAMLYLNEVAAVAVANDRLQTLQAEQTRLTRQDALLHAQLGHYTSPAYIDQQARALGLQPPTPGSAVYLTVPAPVVTGGMR